MDLGLLGERPRPMGSRPDRRAVAHSGWGSQACSLSVDLGTAAVAGGADTRVKLPSGAAQRREMDLGLRGRAAAAR
jgi:hypothetical protein